MLAHSHSVVLQDEQILSNYTIRSFKVTLKDQVGYHGIEPQCRELFAVQRYEDSGESRVVTQFHFTGWPDHGVPENTESMLQFVRRVRSDIVPSHGPLIIHCRSLLSHLKLLIQTPMGQKCPYFVKCPVKLHESNYSWGKKDVSLERVVPLH